MPDTPLENWDLVPGTLVEVHKDGMMLRTGRIDAVTLDADIVWLADNGSHPRGLFEKSEGYQLRLARDRN
ncbi:hypothetical protein [Arthrobacter sp. NPDC089319]|uniref:hypothetical protein n=1 Tax=Arthrobacter sp. NPDC089319 TaxID=3155915 RepID=UPI003434F0A2